MNELPAHYDPWTDAVLLAMMYIGSGMLAVRHWLRGTENRVAGNALTIGSMVVTFFLTSVVVMPMESRHRLLGSMSLWLVVLLWLAVWLVVRWSEQRWKRSHRSEGEER